MKIPITIHITEKDATSGKRLKTIVTKALHAKARNMASKEAFESVMSGLCEALRDQEGPEPRKPSATSQHRDDAMRYAQEFADSTHVEAVARKDAEEMRIGHIADGKVSIEKPVTPEEIAQPKVDGRRVYYFSEPVSRDTYTSWDASKRVCYRKWLQGNHPELWPEFKQFLDHYKGDRKKRPFAVRRRRHSDTKLGLFLANIADGESNVSAWEAAGYPGTPEPWELSGIVRKVKPHIEFFKALPYGQPRMDYLREWFGMGDGGAQ